MTQPDPRAAIDFALELVDRLGSAHLPWAVMRTRTGQCITNDAACLIAECSDSSGIVPELIVRVVNTLPEIAVELGLRHEEQKGRSA